MKIPLPAIKDNFKKCFLYMIILIALISIVFGAYITSCQNINSDGTYYLANNLVSSGNCIVVNAQNVVIDGQGYSITSSGHGIVINVSSFNISIVNVNISSNQNSIYREGFVENSTITIYNSTLISNGSNLLVRNQSHSVNSLSIEIQNSTLNSSGNNNIYFSINTSSNNTIRIVNSSMYANHSNIVPNTYLNGSVENLVLEVVNSTLNASNSQNVYFYTNTSSNNIIRIVNSSLYGNYSNIIPNDYLNGFVENLVLEIIDSNLNASNYHNIYFYTNKSSNNTIRVLDSFLYANHSNIVPNIYSNSSVENLVIEIIDSNLNASNYYNIYFYTNTSSNNIIRIVNSSMYGNRSNIVPNEYSNGSIENLVLEILNSTLSSLNRNNIYFSINTSSNNTIRIVNSSLYANHSNIVPNTYLNGSVENLVLEVVNSTLNASNSQNVYFYTNTSSNNIIRIVNSSLYGNYSNIIPNDYLNGFVENLVLEIIDSTLNASKYHNIYFYTNTSSNNIIRIVNSSLHGKFTNILPNDYSGGSVENLVLEIIDSNLNASDLFNIRFYTNKSLNNIIKVVNSYIYANNSNILPNNYVNSSVENLVIEIIDSTLNASNYRNIYFYTNTSSNNIIRIVNSSLYGNYSNIIPNDNVNGFVENLVLEIIDSNLNASNYHNIYFYTNKSSNNTIRVLDSFLYANHSNIVPNIYSNSSVENLVIEIIDSNLNASNYYNIYFYTNTSSNNIIRIVNSSLYGNRSNIVPNEYSNGSIENLVLEILNSTLSSLNRNNIYFSINTSSNNTIRIVDSTLNASNSQNVYFYTNTSSNNTIRIVNSSLYGNYRNIIPNDNVNGFVENLVLEIIDSTLNASNYHNIYFYTNTSSNNIIKIVNSSLHGKFTNILPNDYSGGSVENLVLEIMDSTLNASDLFNIRFYTNKSLNNIIKVVNSYIYANNSNILPNNYVNSSVENLVIEIIDSTLNASNYHNIYFYTNTSSNNTIKIVNSSMYANHNNIIPNSYSNASVNNLVIEILGSTLNASNSENINVLSSTFFKQYY
jgi:hypothetical protein